MIKFNLPKGQREYYFILSLGVILVIIVILIGFISLQSNQSGTQKPTPLPHPTESQTLISPTQTPFTKPPVTYNRNASVRLIQKEEQRTPLSASDVQAKNNIFKLLPSGQNYGEVYSSDTISIQYVQSLDLFKVEILTADVASAKKEAENWFKQQGMSQQGICDLPLGFYLSWDVANLLRNSGFIFNPLPDGC